MNSARLSLNPPFWSLCYEFWYYVIFGVFFFFKGAGYKKFILCSIVLLLIGPSVSILMPAWLVGVGLTFASFKLKNNIFCFFTLLLSFFLITAIVEFQIDLAIQHFLAKVIPSIWRLTYSTKFLTDIVISILVAMFLWSASLLLKSNFSHFVELCAKKLAGFSFTLYLFHDPILRVIKFYLDTQGVEITQLEHWCILCLTLAISWFVASFTEAKTSILRNFIFGFISGNVFQRKQLKT